MEIWKEATGLKGKYEVSDKGRLRNIKSGRILKTKWRRGYEWVSVKIDGKYHSPQIHRLVLKSFKPITNPSEFEVHHKDLNRANNSLGNLEWTTKRQNLNMRGTNNPSYHQYRRLLYSLGEERLFKLLCEVSEGS